MIKNMSRDMVSGQLYPDTIIKQCPHPAVIKKYGVNGIVYTSMFTCLKCSHVQRFKNMGAIGCGYGKEDNGNTTTN